MLNDKILVLIDGNNLIYRAFYAVPLLSNDKNEYTNGVYGFVRMLTKIITDVKPDYLCVAMDMKGPTFRHEMFTEYKAQRKPMPEELRPQIPLLKQVLKVMGITVIEKEGFEADDIIGAIAKCGKTKTIIFTGDRDSFQLVDETTSVYFLRQGITETEQINHVNFSQKTGINPGQVIELKALMGDSSDNIPGVDGVGEKTALMLVQKYGNLENLYNKIDEVQGKLKEKLINGKDIAFLSRELATINTKCNVEFDVAKMKFPFPFGKAVKDVFMDLRFTSLLKNQNLFEAVPQAQTIEITSLDSLKQLLTNVSEITFCLEKFAFFADGAEYKVKVAECFFAEGISADDFYAAIMPAAENPAVKKIFYNLKEARYRLKEFNIAVNNAEDVSIMKYLCDFSGKEESFEDAVLFYGLPASAPAASLYSAYKILKDKLAVYGMESLYRDVELKLSAVLFDMEVAGFKIDIAVLKELKVKYETKLNFLSENIYNLTGVRFNLNSPKQLSEVLFEKLGLKHGKKIKTGYSTGIDILEELTDEHAAIPLIIEYRSFQKLLSVYVDGLIPLIGSGGIVHTDFKQTATATGRLSSREPNLQNIPIRDEEGREIRRFFIPSKPDNILISADYSQIELRLLAEFSKDPKLMKAYKEDADIHTLTASQVFSVPQGNVTAAMRRDAKAVNFGMIYGQSEYGLKEQLKISVQAAKEYMQKYFESYPAVKGYMEENVRKAKENGYLTTVLGRRRVINELFSANYNTRGYGERIAMNMPLQGSSADIIKVAMIRVYERLKKENLKSKLILQVHDELIIDADIAEKERVSEILKYEMENAVKLSVPLSVQVSYGRNLMEAK